MQVFFPLELMNPQEAVGDGNAAAVIFSIYFQAVLNQKFTDCFVLVFLDAQAGKTVSL